MLIKFKHLSLIIITIMFYGCASMPDTTIGYHIPKSKINVVVSQTVSCIKTSKPIVETNVKFTPVYYAGSGEFQIINLSELDTWYSTGNVEITLTSDGRLLSFGADSTGVGNEIVDTLVSLVTLSTSITKSKKPLSLEETKEKQKIRKIIKERIKTACEEVNKLAEKKDNKPLPLSIVLRSVINFSDNNTPIFKPFVIDSYPKSIYMDIKDALGALSYAPITSLKKEEIRLPLVNSYKKGRSIMLVEPNIATIKLNRTPLGSRQIQVFEAKVNVPQWGESYYVPIPKPPFFGNNLINLTLHESGKIKTLKFGVTNGAKNLGASFKALNNTLVTSDEKEAKKLKDEADVLAQQQRLIVCKVTPEQCK